MKKSNLILLITLGLILISMFAVTLWFRISMFSEVMAGDQNLITRELQLESFERIEVSGNYNVYFSLDKISSMKITADSNVIHLVNTEVKDGKLSISSRERFLSKKLRIDIVNPYLSEISLSMGAQFFAENFLELPLLNIFNHSGSELKLEGNINTLKVSSNSGSTTELKGQAVQVDIQTSSGSNVKAQELSAQVANLQASSGSSIQIHVEKEMTVGASSGSTIQYLGEPIILGINLSSGANLKRIEK